MARLLTAPDFGLVSLSPISGPNARNSGSNTASDGSEQTFDAIGQIWAFQIEYVFAQGREARRQRGLLNSGLLSGANAMRWTVVDGDIMTPAEAGLVGEFTGQPWSNEEPWSNQMSWGASYPVVPVAESAAANTGIIALEDHFWGHNLGLGDWIGFMPFHFGLYEISEVIEPGRYRIWPRLRKAIAPSDYATLHPVIVLKLTGQGAARLKRGIYGTEGQGADFVEVIDPYVRQYFTD